MRLIPKIIFLLQCIFLHTSVANSPEPSEPQLFFPYFILFVAGAPSKSMLWSTARASVKLRSGTYIFENTKLKENAENSVLFWLGVKQGPLCFQMNPDISGFDAIFPI